MRLVICLIMFVFAFLALIQACGMLSPHYSEEAFILMATIWLVGGLVLLFCKD